MDVPRCGDPSPCPVGLIGDLDDPWILGIADRIAAGRPVDRVNCAGCLPDRPFGDANPPRAVVIHRHTLGPADAERLEQWRARAGSPVPELILCISPYVRYAELERWARLVDLVVSEAVAAEILPGRLARRLDGSTRRRPPPGRTSCSIEVAAGDDGLRRVLVDACTQAGYTALAVDDQEIGEGPRSSTPDRRRPARERVLTIWEVPVLDADWARRLEWRSHRTGPVITLAGFADRAVVTRARDAAAVACLELPCELEDLIDVVDRVTSLVPPDSWPLPARTEIPHALPAPRRGARSQRSPVAASRWPDRGATPTIPISGK
jgi:hypothetical protein